jgi:hypothetical protein
MPLALVDSSLADRFSKEIMLYLVKIGQHFLRSIFKHIRLRPITHHVSENSLPQHIARPRAFSETMPQFKEDLCTPNQPLL